MEQIGVLENRDPSTIGYWVNKHGLVPNGRARHAARGRLSREQLVALVDRRMTLAEIAREVDRSPATVRYWLRKFDLKTKNHRGPRPRPKIGPDEIEMVCGRHGITTFFLRKSVGIYSCKKCRSEAVIRRRRKVKATLVAEAGGCCKLCGYDRWVGALQFHHRDPSKKKFGLSRKGVTVGIDVLRAEAKKCVLLCANCHAEVEGGIATLA